MRDDGLGMVVIADDITGAAEIAGIAYGQGQTVRLVCDAASLSAAWMEDGANGTTTVIATDTRSLNAKEAAAETRRIAASFPTPHPSFHFFKKTDSALRGHVVEELVALMQALDYQRAVYLPANPSRGRIIRHGIYYIKEKKEGQEAKEVPLHKTDFSFDPDFPARTSTLHDRFPDAEAHGILMPDATCQADIHRLLADYDDGHTLFAGAADLFTQIIGKSGGNDRTSLPLSRYISPLSSTLILCGSTQSKPLHLGIPVIPMPISIYDGADDLSLWDTSAYATMSSAILTIPYTHRHTREAASHLRTMMAAKACDLIASQCPSHLIIEGGATAWTTLQALGWTAFTIVAQHAPGVVTMRAQNGTLVTLKPGSYPWQPETN